MSINSTTLTTDGHAPSQPGAALLDLLAERFSASNFDPDLGVDAEAVDVLLDAARRAPSAGNSQPWSFIVGRRDDPAHAAMVRNLAPSTRTWAPDAALLIANLAHLYIDSDTDELIEYSEFAHYDLGQAVAHLTVQATSMGLSVHQFRAFDRGGVAADFAVPATWEVVTMAAIGYPRGGTPRIPDRGHSSSTADRRPLADITWTTVSTQP